MHLYRLITHVESHLTFKDVETFVLSMMDVQHTPSPWGRYPTREDCPPLLPVAFIVTTIPNRRTPRLRPGRTRRSCCGASSASSMAPVAAWSSVAAMVSYSFPYTTVCREK